MSLRRNAWEFRANRVPSVRRSRRRPLQQGRARGGVQVRDGLIIPEGALM
jgi:hypothetical protein